mgnify:CR=1 FL=1
MAEENLEKVYNSPEYYVDRIFQDALLPRYNEIRRNDNITKIFYFIDLPNVFLGHFNPSIAKDKKYKRETDISGSHSGGDRICNIMVETLLNILFDKSWYSMENNNYESIYQKINNDTKNYYFGMNFFTQRSQNQYRNDFCFGPIKNDKDVLPDLINYFDKIDENYIDFRKHALHTLLKTKKLIVDITLNYAGDYCCNEFTLSEKFQDTLKSNIQIFGPQITGFKDLDNNEIQQNFNYNDIINNSKDDEIKENCLKVPIVGNDDVRKLPRNLPIEPSIYKFFDEIGGGANSNSILHSIKTKDDALLLKWYTYFYYYFFTLENNADSDNVYLSIISNDNFYGKEGRRSGNFSEVKDLFRKVDSPQIFKDVKDQILNIANDTLTDLDDRILHPRSNYSNNDNIENKYGFKYIKKGKFESYNELWAIGGIKLADFLENNITGDKAVESIKGIVNNLSTYPFMERSVAYSINEEGNIDNFRKSPSQRQFGYEFKENFIDDEYSRSDSSKGVSVVKSVESIKSESVGKSKDSIKSESVGKSVDSGKKISVDNSLSKGLSESDIKLIEEEMRKLTVCNNVNSAKILIDIPIYIFPEGNVKVHKDNQDVYLKHKKILESRNFYYPQYKDHIRMKPEDRKKLYLPFIEYCEKLEHYINSKMYRNERNNDYIEYDEYFLEAKKKLGLTGGGPKSKKSEPSPSGIRLKVQPRLVSGKNILTSTYVNYLPIISPKIENVIYSYNECNYKEKKENWLIK